MQVEVALSNWQLLSEPHSAWWLPKSSVQLGTQDVPAALTRHAETDPQVAIGTLAQSNWQLPSSLRTQLVWEQVSDMEQDSAQVAGVATPLKVHSLLRVHAPALSV